MKLITLNAWGGRVKPNLENFLKGNKEVDIILLQEVYNKDVELIQPEVETQPNRKLSKDLDLWLDKHHQHFSPAVKDHYGTSILINKNIELLAKGEELVSKGEWYGKESHPDMDHNRKAQWAEVMVEGKKLLLVNVHLTHRPEGKMDTEKRIFQTQKILDLMAMFPHPKILGGDFNLLPDSKSIQMFGEAGYKNLIKEFNVTSTRTDLYKKPLRFADYVFVSPEIKVNDFKVMPDVVSDHSPLFLEFEII